MSKSNADQCLEYLVDGAIPKGDADISGNGVVLAFIISAYITFIAVLLAYITGFVDAELLNPVDRQIFRIRPYIRKHPRVHITIRNGILAMGDQQIVTGIAILGAGFQGLRTGKISVYHYQIVLYLAWMSSSVHLSALTILGSYLTKNPGLMIWRVTGMLVLLVLLLVALIPTISNDWGLIRWKGMLPEHSGWGIPARCFWGRLWGDGISSDSVLGFVLLGVSYFWKVGALFPVAASSYNRWIRHPVEVLSTRMLLWTAHRHKERPTWYWLLTFRIVVASCLPGFGMLAMLASFAASLWLSVLGLVFGTMQVLIPRSQNLWYTYKQEDSWSFGQLVPLILLVQPLGSISEHVWPGEAEHNKLGDAHQSRQPPAPVSELGSWTPEEGLQATTLLQYLRVQDSQSASDLRPKLMILLYESKLFALVIILINCAIIATASIVYAVDAYAIGNAKVPKWELTAECIGYCILGILCVGFVLTPLSRLGQVRTGRPWKIRPIVKESDGRNLLDEGGSARQRSLSAVEMAEMKP